MFHLTVVFLPILLLGLGMIMAALLLTGLGLLIAALVGGTSAALLVQNKDLRRLLLLGCGILALSGIACVGLVLNLPYFVAAGCCLVAAALAVAGLCSCKCVANKAGRVVAVVLFAAATAVVLLCGIVISVIGIG